MDCGPACLQMVSYYWGKKHSLAFLRERAYISREGVTLLGLSDAAESIGLEPVSRSMAVSELVAASAYMPCVLYWDKKHFVVLRHTDGRRFKISDPAAGNVVYTRDEFAQHWVNDGSRGVVLFLAPTEAFYVRPSTARRQLKQSLARYLRLLAPFVCHFPLLFLAAVIGCAIQFVIPALTQALVDKGVGQRDVSVIAMIVCAQMVLFVSQTGVGFVRARLLVHLNARIDLALVSDFIKKLMRLPLRFFDSKKTGDIMQRFGDHGKVKSLLMDEAFEMAFALINLVVFSVMLGCYSLTVLTVFFVGNILALLWTKLLMKYRRVIDIKRFNLEAAEQSNVIQLIQGMPDIKLHNAQQRKLQQWAQTQVNIFNMSLKGLSVAQIQQSGEMLLAQTANLLITFIVAKNVVDNVMTLGMMMSISYITGQLSAGMSQITAFLKTAQQAGLSLERINEVYDCDDEEAEVDGMQNVIPSHADIVIDNVSFSYSGSPRETTIAHLNLIIPYGKVTAIVGESGSGKTTVIKMLQGFYRPQEGRILVGGVPLQQIRPYEWRQYIGAVMQEGYIFSDTISNNIAIGDSEIDSERFERAARIAEIEPFVGNLPLRYSTAIGAEGIGLSTGQKQRILLARAVYKDPGLLLLDEATNALDALTEDKIMRRLEDFFQERTVVIAAHRLSTIIKADNIAVMDKGQIVEQGNHEYLMSINGRYANLINKQLHEKTTRQ